ncbi:uncharacterized protein NECHADRAFT_56771, partial [Fusarium vanettenii 77-13-4]
FDIKKNSLGVYSRYINRDKERTTNKPYFFSATNSLNFGEVPGNLPSLIIIKEILITRVHVYIKYKYRGYIIYFLCNISRLFKELPVLPKELDIMLLRPPNIEGDPYF